MHRHNLPTKLVASALVLAISGLAGAAWAGTGSASLSGRVLAAGSGVPLTGWTVLIGNPQTKTIQSSTKTNADGTFSVVALPAGTYEIAVQSGGTLYPANGAVKLAPGQTRDIQLAVNQQQVAPPPGTPDPNDKGGGSWWSNPVVATLLVVGGAILIGVVVDNMSSDDDVPASASAPTQTSN